jgi:RNA polymerase sigma-70 factor (ECF subfamily)
MKENGLIKRCQEGEKEAFQELISKYHPYVYKFLIKITGDEYLAEDLTQETFIKLIRNIEKFDIYGKASLSTYIITISRNCYIDHLRKQKKLVIKSSLDENINLEDINMNIENIVMDKIESEEALDKIEDLSDEQKVVIKMKYIEGFTLKEIGDKLDLQPKTVKSRIHNGIVKLRKMFGKDDE